MSWDSPGSHGCKEALSLGNRAELGAAKRGLQMTGIEKQTWKDGRFPGWPPSALHTSVPQKPPFLEDQTKLCVCSILPLRLGPAGLGQSGVAADCFGDAKTQAKVGFQHPLFHPIYCPYSPSVGS